MPIVGQFGSLAGFGVFPGGALESIATVTVGSGGAAEVTFSDIPGSFQHVQLRFAAYANGLGWVTSRPNGITSSGQRSHRLRGNGSTAEGATTTDSQVYLGSHDAAGYVSGVVDILDYASTTKNKVYRALVGCDRNGSGEVTLSSALYESTTALTSLVIRTTSSGFAQHSTFALYGVRG